MEFTTVPSSELMASSRMDASFFVALDRVRGRYQILRERLTEGEARAWLKLIPKRALAPAMILARGGQQCGFSDKTLRSVCKEYPYLALAIAEPELANEVERLGAEIAKHQEALSHVLSIRDQFETLSKKPAPNQPAM